MKKRSLLCLAILSVSFFARAQDTGEQKFDQAYNLYDQGMYNKALEAFKNIQNTYASNEEYFLFRGLCYSELDEIQLAIQDFDKAIALNPDYSEAYYQRGFSFFTIGDNSSAIKDFNQSIFLEPDFAEAYLNRGSVKYDAQDNDGACKDWKKAVNLGLGVAQTLIDQICN